MHGFVNMLICAWINKKNIQFYSLYFSKAYSYKILFIYICKIMKVKYNYRVWIDIDKVDTNELHVRSKQCVRIEKWYIHLQIVKLEKSETKRWMKISWLENYCIQIHHKSQISYRLWLIVNYEMCSDIKWL